MKATKKATKRAAKRVTSKAAVRPEPVGSDLVEVMRATIKASGLSHYAIANAAGITPDILDRFQRGERDMRLATASKLAAVLGLELRKA